MIASLFLLLQAGAQGAPPAPKRSVDDPGVIATDQRVTPAGLQTVLVGRVGGVRFGREPGELWVSVPGATYRIAWRDNKVVASSALDGRPGVHGVAVDPITGRVFVSSVGRLPSDVATSRTPGTRIRGRVVAQLTAYDPAQVHSRPGAADDSAVVAASSPALGDYMAGATAIARRANASGHRVAVVALPANDALAVLDAADGSLLRTIPLGVLPVGAVVSEDGRTAFVTVFGGPKPKPGTRAASQCCDPMAEPVGVDARGMAEPGTVSRVDLDRGVVDAGITVGLHPTGLAWDEQRARLYVANGNSDDVTVINTTTNTVSGTIPIAPFRQRRIGLAPTAAVLSPDGRMLYVALGGANAVAVIDVSATPRLRGLIPTGWYPSSIDVSADGGTLAVGTLLGVGSGTATIGGLTGRYVHAVRGSVNVIPLPNDAELAAYTTSVAQNNRFTLERGATAPQLAARTGVRPRPVPERPGEPSLIDHVVYVIRENRTYDQVLGDLGKGASDPSLVMFGRDVTPNAHALAEQFVVLDHFFASGGNSADGHQWLTQANETEYPMWPLYYGRSYPSEGNDPLTYSSGGFLWEAAEAKGKSVTVFGEYAPAPRTSSSRVRDSLFEAWRAQPSNLDAFRSALGRLYDTHSEIPSLDKVLVREYPGWTQEAPDVVKAADVLDHLSEWESRHAMPDLVMIVLPNDHTQGTSAGWCTPKACVADNDLALGQTVEGLSRSSFWKSMAIVIVEDDAQNGVDHIDGHRTVALVASPYARRGVIDSTFYSQPSMVKTIELMLGLPALSMFDLVATDMRASFIGPADKPNLAPYTAEIPRQSLYETNPRANTINGQFAARRRAAALASGRMDFREPDAAPSEQLNRILWSDARGWGTKYPTVRHSLFFPLAIDLADDEREDKGEQRPRGKP